MKLDIVNVIDIVLALMFLVAICRGWHVGLVMKLGHLAALVGAGILAGVAAGILKTSVSSQWLVPYLERQAGEDLASMDGLGEGISLVAENMAYYLLFGVIFVVALVVLHRVVGVLKLVDYIPVVGALNKFGGAVIGFVAEFVFFFILGRILFGLIPMESWAQIGLAGEMIEKSYLLQAFVP